MSLSSKIRDKTQVIKGWARQHLGRATGNRRQQVAGGSDQVMGNMKQSGRKVKDAFKR
jgi:uncharacterized protein YjbJ (UPF0337 family)